MKQLVKITQFFFVFFVILSCQKKSDESSNVVEKDSVVETHSTSNDEPNTEFYKELSLQGNLRLFPLTGPNAISIV